MKKGVALAENFAVPANQAPNKTPPELPRDRLERTLFGKSPLSVRFFLVYPLGSETLGND
jgi:hypothetical protein